MEAIRGWKKSQTSSGYYHKEPNRVPSFVKFKSVEDSNGVKGYVVTYKKGLDGDLKYIGGFYKTKAQALKFAKSWMLGHPKG